MPKVIFVIYLLYACGASWGRELRVEILREGDGALVRMQDTDLEGSRLQMARSLDATDFDHLVFDGDSIVAGNNVPGAEYWRAVAQSLGVSCTNVAFPGATTVQLLERFPSKVAPLFRANSVLIFGAGVNDLTQGTTVAEVKQHIEDYLQRCAAVGWASNRIFIRPISASYFSGNFTTANRAEINRWLLAKYPNCALDPAMEPRLYAFGANNNTNYFGDLTHPNAAGTALDAAAMAAKVSAHCWVLAGEWRPGDTARLPLAMSITNGMRFFRSATIAP